MLDKAFERRSKSGQIGEREASKVRNGLETSFCTFLIFVARLRSTRTDRLSNSNILRSSPILFVSIFRVGRLHREIRCTEYR